MKIIKTNLDGLFIIENFYQEDNRGSFIKVFNYDLCAQYGIDFIPKEIYYSISKKDVIRGMHFQIPPYDHTKLVFVVKGKVLDVVVDLRKKSSTFGKVFSIILVEKKNALYIPSGFAHGFRSLEEYTIVVYNQTSCYSKEHDMGILWNSIDFDWGVENPIISDRDSNFISFNKFNSPFDL